MTSRSEAAIRHGTFRVGYWGTTGSFARPLLPGQVTDKIVASIQTLLETGDWQRLAADPSADSIRDLVERRLPFHARSTYGGNTTCIEIDAGDELMILDSGSGFRELSVELHARWSAPQYHGPRRAHVLLSHSHLDHIFATPFIERYYEPENEFIIWAPQQVLDSLDALFSAKSSLRGVYVPPTFDQMSGIKEFRPIEPGTQFSIGETTVSTFPLCHPGGCLAYRFERDGRKLVFASDHEHEETPDRALAEFAGEADLLYLDAQYWMEEYEGRASVGDQPPRSRRGWGHSTVEQAVATAAEANVRRLHLGHHESLRDDEPLAELEAHAARLMEQTLAGMGRPPGQVEVVAAYEGLTLDI